MSSLLERIRNVFTDEMYSQTEAQGSASAAVEDARTYMAQALIDAVGDVETHASLANVAVSLGANQTKLEQGLQGIKDAFSVNFMRRDRLPEDLALSPDQATLLCCISNIHSEVTGERLYMEMRAAGIGSRGDMDRLNGDLKALREQGLVTECALDGYRKGVDLTDDGRAVAQNDISFRKQDLLADLADRKEELQDELKNVTAWTDDNGNKPGLSPEGFAEYLEALSLIDQVELSISNGVPLQVTGDIPKDSVANLVIEDFRQRLAQVGTKIERVQELAQTNGQEQEKSQELAAGRGMGMRA